MASRQSSAFGQLLRRYRRAARLSQEALATRAGLGVHTIADLERGVTHSPHPHTIAALANALRLPDASLAAFAAAGRRNAVSLFEEAQPGLDASPRAPLLVGRARERAVSERLLAGEGPLLLLFSGEPGIGKSRLLHEVAAEARAPSEWPELFGDPLLASAALDRLIHRAAVVLISGRSYRLASQGASREGKEETTTPAAS
jgi:transcriptional regulator with XRE-family HTH domain